MRFLSTMGWDGYGMIKNRVLTQMSRDLDGHLFFPFYPWTPIMIAMNCTPLLNIAISITLLFICINLLISIELFEDEDNENISKSPVYFTAIGSFYLICGFILNVIMVVLPNIGFFVYPAVYAIFGSLTSTSLTLFLGGFLAFSVADRPTVSKKFMLFILSSGNSFKMLL